MADTFTQLHIHAVFAVKFREAVVNKGWKGELERYISALFQDRENKVIQVNCQPDHAHVMFGLNPRLALSDLMQTVKGESSKWINTAGLCNHKFLWQGGFGAFSVSKSVVPIVTRYIQNQEAHHRKTTFLSEYKVMLQELEPMHKPHCIFEELI